MHTPAQRAGKSFFCGTGLLTVMRKNQHLVPRSNFGLKACARTAPWFRGQTLLFLGHAGGGGGYPFLSLPVSTEGARRLCPNNARCCFRNILELHRCLRLL